jgi:hypothetical protein
MSEGVFKSSHAQGTAERGYLAPKAKRVDITALRYHEAVCAA